MPTSAELRERSRVAVVTARRLGTKNIRSRSFAAYALALALEGEQMERASVNYRKAPFQHPETARDRSTHPVAKQTTLEISAQISA